MDRLEIFVLNKSAEVYTRYVDVPSVVGFIHRTGRPNAFHIIAHKGKRCLFIEKIDITTLQKELMEFQIKG